jgi:hypothetical protein
MPGRGSTATVVSLAAMALGIFVIANDFTALSVAGGSIGLGLNTAIVLSASSLEEGIRIAFFVDAALGLVATAVVLASIHGEGTAYQRHLHLHHRAHG